MRDLYGNSGNSKEKITPFNRLNIDGIIHNLDEVRNFRKNALVVRVCHRKIMSMF